MMIEDKHGRLRPEELIKREPPAPPPMRETGKRVPGDGLGFYLGVIVVCVTFGIYCGWRMAGGICA